MTHFTRFSLAAFLIAAFSTYTGAQQVDAWIVTSRATMTSTLGFGPDADTSTIRTTISGNSKRIERKSKIGTQLPTKMDVILMVPGDKGIEMIVLDTIGKTFLNFTKMVSSIPGMMSMEFTNVTVKVDSLGAGPNIKGYPTLHYRMTTNGVMKMSVGSETMSSPIISTSDSYITMSVQDSGLVTAYRNVEMENMKNIIPFLSLDSLMSAMRTAQGKMPIGLTLHNVQTQTLNLPTQDAIEGKDIVMTTTTDLDTWEHKKVDKSLFAIPAGYTEQEFGNMITTKKSESGAGW